MQTEPAASGQKRTNRRAILAAGTEVVLRRGYVAASMEEIAAEAGVSKQTIYNHFPSKEALFRAIIDDLTGQLTASLPEPSGSADPATALASFARRFLDLSLAEGSIGLHRVLVAEAPRFPQLARAIFEAGPERAVARLADWFRDQNRRGILEIDNPSLAAEQFVGALRGNLQLRAVFMKTDKDDRQRIETAISHAVATVFRAYAPGRVHRARPHEAAFSSTRE